MTQHAVLTAVGADKPGLVDAVSKYILGCGGNIEDSRMAILGGEFAMLILVAGEAPVIQRLIAGAEAAGAAAGLSVQAKPTRSPDRASQAGALPYEICAYSMDHPGIVQRLSAFLAQRQINIRALDTRLTYAPVTGLPLFSIHALVDLPAKQNVAEVRRGLEQLCAQENIDVELRPAGK